MGVWKMTPKEKEVYLSVTAILDEQEEKSQFTELLKLALEGY